MTSDGSDLPADTGLAVQRTTLSWTRTALVAAALGALLLRTGVVHRSPQTLSAAAISLLDAIVVAVIGRLRAVGITRRLAEGRAVAAPNSVGVAAAVTAIATVSAALVLIFG